MAGKVAAVTILALLTASQPPSASATRIRQDELISNKQAQSSPEQQAHAAVSASLAQAKSALSAISSMAALKPEEGAVLRDCLAAMRDSVERLRKAEEGMGGEGRAWVENARTWVSAALTEDNMCADELSGVDLGGKREAVRGLVVRAASLTSSALALISGLDSPAGIAP